MHNVLISVRNDVIELNIVCENDRLASLAYHFILGTVVYVHEELKKKKLPKGDPGHFRAEIHSAESKYEYYVSCSVTKKGLLISAGPVFSPLATVYVKKVRTLMKKRNIRGSLFAFSFLHSLQLI